MKAKKKSEASPELVKLVKGLVSGLGVDAEALAKQDEKEDRDAGAALEDEARRQAKEPHFWVSLIRMPDDKESHVFVGAAGVAYQLEKGVKMPVPESVLKALEMAHVEGFVPVSDGTGEKKQARVSYDRYPVQIFGEAPLKDVAAWKAEQRKKMDRRAGVVQAPAEAVETWGAPHVEFSDPERVLTD